MYFVDGDCSIPCVINKSSIDTLVSNMCGDVYIKTEIDTLCSNLDLNNQYTKTEIDDLDNELPTLMLNTYNKSEIGTFLIDYYDIEYLNTQFGLKADSLNTYTRKRCR